MKVILTVECSKCTAASDDDVVPKDEKKRRENRTLARSETSYNARTPPVV